VVGAKTFQTGYMPFSNSAERIQKLPFLKEIYMAKQFSAQGAVKVSSLMVELDALVKERETFEREEYARSNQRLYEILTKVYRAYTQAKTSDSVLKDTVKQMKAVLQQSGERVQVNTLAINLFVRYVFRTSRQRAHNYSRTLQAAFAKSIAPDALPQFIADGGGVEECKKEFVKSPKTVEREAKIASAIELVKEQLTGDNINLAEISVPADWVAKTHGEELTFLVGKADKTGKVRVTSVVPVFSKGMATWAKKQLALFLADQQAASQKQAKVKRKDAAITAASKQAKKKNSAAETVGELLDA